MSFDLFIPPAYPCTDNAAMIAWAGHEYMALDRIRADFAPRPRWPLDSAPPPPPPGRGVRFRLKAGVNQITGTSQACQKTQKRIIFLVFN